MTLKDILQKKLESHVQFRERANRDTGLAILALRDAGYEERYSRREQLTLKEMAIFAKKYDSYRHEYDAVMREYPDLRGSDYEDGKVLAQEKQIEFGYEVGYHQDIKKGKTIV